MDGVDKAKQAQVIYESSKDSEYFKRAALQDEKVDVKVRAMLESINTLTETEIGALRVKSLKRMVEVESKRNFDRICCVLDMDMFFAAVEIRDRPHLKNLPVAVGGMGMISTANYVARKFGVRSAMPGFIGKKLCPELVFVSPNFEKYEEAGGIVRKIIAEYDANFRSHSLDEVYMDLTEASLKRIESVSLGPISNVSSESLRNSAITILEEIRQKVTTQTRGLTCSAGIANNFMLAKICADVNKPDGQFALAPSRLSIIEFVSTLPTRKIGGIGKVTERMLSSLGMNTMQDVRDQLHKILYCFTPATAEFLLRASLGIAEDEGSDPLRQAAVPVGAVTRKSMGAERTFANISEAADMKRKLHDLCEIVSRDLHANSISGQTVTLKLKTTKFELITRSATSSKYLKECAEIETIASKLLDAAMPISIRLMGVTVSKFQNGWDPCRLSATGSLRNIETFFQPKINTKINTTDSQSSMSQTVGACKDSNFASLSSSPSSSSSSTSVLASLTEPAAATACSNVMSQLFSPPPYSGSSAAADLGFSCSSIPYSMECQYSRTVDESTACRAEVWRDHNVEADEDCSSPMRQTESEQDPTRPRLENRVRFEPTEAICELGPSDVGVEIISSADFKSVIGVASSADQNTSTNQVASSVESSVRLITDKKAFVCPICARSIAGTIVALNHHIDKCLASPRATGAAPADLFKILKTSGRGADGSNCVGSNGIKRPPLTLSRGVDKKLRQ